MIFTLLMLGMPSIVMRHPKNQLLKRSDFESNSLHLNYSLADNKTWLSGEGKNGVLHGKWIQNAAPDVPWIEGYFTNGMRSGKWKEYYQGTNILCRTEYWENDTLNGVRTRFDKEGKIIEEITFKKGVAAMKVNTDHRSGLKYNRQQSDSTTVYTTIVNLEGTLLAEGKESIFNPSGRLKWFQNIELTALNSAVDIGKRPVTDISGVAKVSGDLDFPVVEVFIRLKLRRPW